MFENGFRFSTRRDDAAQQMFLGHHERRARKRKTPGPREFAAFLAVVGLILLAWGLWELLGG